MNLPDQMIDGAMHNRFLLVVDGHPAAGTSQGDAFARRFDEFARSVGAAGGLVSREPVEIEEPTASAEMLTEIVRQLDELISRRLDEHVAARTSFHVHGVTVPQRPHEDTVRWMCEASRRARVTAERPASA
ncbi:hypothetical protein [Micromonospora sp. NPDC047730]|uniref:hypothetical protein n=1 Tax=Micromonospora sp. NPDC047730 TaxID=3364253 RepID=UPI00371DC4EA